jgi:hypothetical protein
MGKLWLRPKSQEEVMSQKFTVIVMLVVILLSAAATLALQEFLRPSRAVAQEPASPLEELTIFANAYGSRRHDRFTFINRQTGDIWVYHNNEVAHHYRFIAVGEDLERVE